MRRAIMCCAVAGLLLAAAGFYRWAQAPYAQPLARRTAVQFLELLRAKDYAQAHRLTVQHTFVGTSPEALKAIAQRQMCATGLHIDDTFPPQSNGNRLRRLLAGREVDMDEVHVEFDGGCLLGVTLRRSGDGSWKVFRFASHAG